LPLWATLDRDGDGLSDIWAALYPTAGAPEADPDGDGATNRAEALAGTDPTSASNRLAATPQRDASGNLVLYWAGVAGKHYSIESSANLSTWTALPGEYTGAGAALSAIVCPAGTPTGSRQFWRVTAFDADTDSDGLNDWEEAQLGTSPTASDTDHDGLPDGWEVVAGLDPVIRQSPGVPPSAPTELNTIDQTKATVVLNWGAAVGAPGRSIIGYMVYCNGVLVDQVQALDRAVYCKPNGECWLYFTVRAIDDTGALSAASNERMFFPDRRWARFEVREASASARRWGIASPVSKRLYRSFTFAFHEEQNDVTWTGGSSHLINDLAWSLVREGQTMGPGVSSFIGEMNSQGRADAPAHAVWNPTAYNGVALDGCASTTAFTSQIENIPPSFLEATGEQGDSFSYSGSGTFDYEVYPRLANRRTWTRVATCILSDEFTEADLLGYIDQNYRSAMAEVSGLPWNYGASCYQGELSTRSLSDGFPNESAFREVRISGTQGILEVRVSGTQYRFSREGDEPFHFRWVEQFWPKGGTPEIVARHDEIGLPVGGVAISRAYTCIPPEASGSVYVHVLSGEISVLPAITEDGTTHAYRNYLKGALYAGECMPVDLDTYTNEVTTGIVAKIMGDSDSVRFYLVDPSVLRWDGQAAAIEDGIPIESGVDLWNCPNSPWNGAHYPARQLVAVGLKPGKVDFALQITMGGVTFDSTLPILVLPQSSLAVDASRDGSIKLPSEDNSDVTSVDKPFRFWLNDDDDHFSSSTGGGDTYKENAYDELNSTHPNYLEPQATSARDLEDFARLWISTQGLNAAFKNGDLYLGLKWSDVGKTGSPAIKVFKHAEADGGLGYLSSMAAASQQISQRAIFDARDEGLYADDRRQTIQGSDVFVLPTSVFSQLSETAPTTHLLFEGAGVGKGELKLIILKKDGTNLTTIGEGPGVWLDLKNLKSMYERVKATADGAENFPFPYNFVGGNAVPSPVMGWVSDPCGYVFEPASDENSTYIVFVHGWNQEYASSTVYAETMFKRLWHRGYKGRFVRFRWPTFTGLTTYNDSEYRAWKCGASLKEYLGTLPSSFTINLVAHSMGNIVAGSALEKGAFVANYALCHAAVPAICYDTSGSVTQSGWGYVTPNDDPDPATVALSYQGRLANVSGNLVNFFLPADSALGAWELNNDSPEGGRFALVGSKPHQWPEGSLDRAGYWYQRAAISGQKLRVVREEGNRTLAVPGEAMAFAVQASSLAVGAEGRTRGSIAECVDLSTYGFDSVHSAEFLFTVQQTRDFYGMLLLKFGVAIQP
jgi:hypothetical protein